MKEIPLTRGLVALVDDEDYDLVAPHKWSAHRDGYAYRNTPHPHKPGKQTMLFMHRYLMGFEYGDPIKVDHRDGDGLNNQRLNLRPATHAQNMCNYKKPVTNTSGYKGVSWHKQHEKWQAKIRVNGKRFSLGTFNTAEEAYAAYCKAANDFHGEFARYA